MKKEFIERVRKEGIVDTRKYRYNGWETPTGQFLIQRMPLEYVNKPDAPERKWETVYADPVESW